MQSAIHFKRGTYGLNHDPNFNFQLNRVIQWNGGRLEDVRPIAGRIHTGADWKRELIALGDTAMAEKRTENAIAYYRMSEFFMYDGDADKVAYYKKATELFYDFYRDYFDSGVVARMDAPYEGVKLPILHAKAQGARKDVLLLHGGNDSYMEEFFFPMLYLAWHGVEVYLFEGPGQGGVVRLQGKKFTHEWERPVKAVLDAIGETDVTIMGASLGGMLAPRAAAFDSRIKRVVGWSIFPNLLYVGLNAVPKGLWGAVKFMLAHNLRGPLNGVMHRKMAAAPAIDWAIRHGMYAYDAADPFEYVKKLDDYKMTNIGPKLTQDMLIFGASKDHFIPKELYSMELDALPNVKSLTYRLMTEAEDGAAHCNVGNPKLVLDTVLYHIAAHLHDLGKIGIADSVLRKPGRLDDAEWSIIKEHTIIGYTILSQIDDFREAADIVRGHHERWDGKGYPDGLCGEAIPQGARIIAVADSIDAMLSTRTYRKGMDSELCRTEIAKNSGTMYDPTVAAAALSHWEALLSRRDNARSLL